MRLSHYLSVDHSPPGKKIETFEATSSILQGFTKSGFMIQFSEVGDKTFFAAAILAFHYPRRLVFSGCLSALIVMTILSATVGWAAPDLISSRKWTHHITTLLFFGFWAMVVFLGRGSEEKQKRASFLTHFSPVFLRAFLITFFAEFGDKSQRATICFAADENPFGVILAGVVSHLLCSTGAVFGLKYLWSQMTEEMVKYAGVMLFLQFGAQSFLTSVESCSSPNLSLWFVT